MVWKTNLVCGASCLRRVTFLLPEKSPKGHLRGHPLDIPVFTGAAQSARFSIDRHALEEMIQRLPRSPATAQFLGSPCLCFGVPGAGLRCTEVCFSLGQRSLLLFLWFQALNHNSSSKCIEKDSTFLSWSPFNRPTNWNLSFTVQTKHTSYYDF